MKLNFRSIFGNRDWLMIVLKSIREFAKEKERVESRAGFMQLKEQQKLEKELKNLEFPA